MAVLWRGRRARGSPTAWREGTWLSPGRGNCRPPSVSGAHMTCVLVPPSCVSSRGREVTPGLREVVLPHSSVHCSQTPEAESGVAVSLQVGRVYF